MLLECSALSVTFSQQRVRFVYIFELHVINFPAARQSRGTAPSHFCRSSGAVARKALQTLESLKLVEKAPNGGRRLTSQGHRDLDRIAAQMKAASKAKATPTVLTTAQ